MNNKQKLLEEAQKWLGKDASPFDSASDELGCAESVCSIIRRSVARDFPLELATWLLLKLLRKDVRFKATLDLAPGNIILSPTGYGNGTIRGHVGIIGQGFIMSANSRTGIWEKNFTIKKWVSRYRHMGGLPIYVFEPTGEYKEFNLKEIQIQISLIQRILDNLQELVKKLLGRNKLKL